MTDAHDRSGWGDVTTGEDPLLEGEVDFPTLGRLVTEEAERFSAEAEDAYVGIAALCDTYEYEDAVAILNHDDEVPRSDDELIAQLNGIAATAYRLARLVRPLATRRRAYFVERAGAESGKGRGPADSATGDAHERSPVRREGRPFVLPPAAQPPRRA